MSKLCREIEHHLLHRAGVTEPNVVVLSYTLITGGCERFEERTNFFLQRWETDWNCYINIDSLEEVVAGDQLTVARRPREPEKQGDGHSTDAEVSTYIYIYIYELRQWCIQEPCHKTGYKCSAIKAVNDFIRYYLIISIPQFWKVLDLCGLDILVGY